MTSARAHVRGVVDDLLCAHANLLFSGSRGVGALLLMATVSEPRYAALGSCSVLSAYAVAHRLKIEARGPASAYGYNALLLGFGIANTYALDGGAALVAAAMGAASALVTAALLSWLGRIAALPVLSLPFIVLSSLASGAVPYLPLEAAIPTPDRWAGALPAWLANSLQSFGAILFLPTVLAGGIVFIALIWHSRISAMLGACGIAATFALAGLAHTPFAHRLLLAASFNAALTSIAVGGVWLVPSRSSFALALGSAILTVLLAVGLTGPLARLGLPLLVVPFNLAVLLVLFALRQRTSDGQPHASDMLSATPEDAVFAFHTKRLAAGTYGIPLQLPFRGVWTCTQGVDGAFTHKGLWRHGFDFEVHAERGGTLCHGEGSRLEDYHCFRLPVLAAADGTVVAVENDIADNAIGETNKTQPWGNRVTLHHGFGLYSTVAHLERGSVAVWLGQFVRRGETLGRCGSSGRSPRPHLHFQLQSGPTMFGATLPCRFTNTVVRDPEGERIFHDVEVREGVALRNLELDAALGSYFDFPIGKTIARLDGAVREHIACELDRWGRLTLRSRELGAALCYRRTEDGFSSDEVSGAARSALFLLAAALPRVPFEGAAVCGWRARVPRRWLLGRVRRAIFDALAPFTDRHHVEIDYRLLREGERLAVVGASVAQRDGEPVVRTRAILQRSGPSLVEVVMRGRARRAVAASSHDAAALWSDAPLPAAEPVLSSVGESS